MSSAVRVAVVLSLAVFACVLVTRRLPVAPLVVSAGVDVGIDIGVVDIDVGVVRAREPSVPGALTVWMADAHISPAADVKGLLRRALGHADFTFIDKSLSGHCHLTDTCARNLRVLTQQLGTGSMPCHVKDQFWRTYKNDAEMRRVDIFFCAHGVAACELYLAFDRPLIIQVTTRYELGRHSVHEWTSFNRLLFFLFREWPRSAVHRPRHVLAANNLFDKHYVQYFTGLSEDEVLLLPSDLSHAVGGAAYGVATRRTLLVGPRRVASEELKRAVVGRFGEADSLLRAQFMGDVYPHYEYSDLCEHLGVILLPYQVSFMTFFELYRMNIPLFAPSLGLLVQWHMESAILGELTWNRVYGRPGPSPLPAAPAYASWPDPNDDRSTESLRFWLAKSDFYTFPHVTTFDSVDDLLLKVNAIEREGRWVEISERMRSYNERQLAETDALVRRLVGRMTDGRRETAPIPENTSYRERVSQIYPSVPDPCY